MSQFFLGVDVGGSKTHALVADENGQALGFGETGPGNHEAVGYDGLAAALQEAVGQALKMTGALKEQIVGAGFGVAGYDWPSERQPTLEAIQTLGLTCPLDAANDMLVGLLAGASSGWGVVVDAGTGDNCMGVDCHGKTAHMTGCGPLFAEFGGAGSIVMRAVQSISLEWGQRGPSTRLTPAFCQLFGVSSSDELLEGLALGNFELMSEAAMLVFKVALEGDPVACEVLAWAGRELGSMVLGIVRQLAFQSLAFDVVLIGSTFNGGPLILDPLKEVVLTEAPRANFIRLEVPPVIGGVLFGMQQTGIKGSESIRQRLVETIRPLLPKERQVGI